MTLASMQTACSQRDKQYAIVAGVAGVGLLASFNGYAIVGIPALLLAAYMAFGIFWDTGGLSC